MGNILQRFVTLVVAERFPELIQSDCVHPGNQNTFIAQLAQALPTAQPRGLCDVYGRIPIHSAREKKSNCVLMSVLIRSSELFSGHQWFLRCMKTMHASDQEKQFLQMTDLKPMTEGGAKWVGDKFVFQGNPDPAYLAFRW